MKILVLSDSHASLSFMRQCIQKLKPAHVVHLGDHYDDAEAMAQTFPHIRFHMVPGNCDAFRCPKGVPEVLCYDIGGVRLYMTHGHRHMVKSGIGHLLAQARQEGAQAVLYGHTHRAECFCHAGIWVLNPGSCGSYGGSVGLLEIAQQKITACRVLQQAEIMAL